MSETREGSITILMHAEPLNVETAEAMVVLLLPEFHRLVRDPKSPRNIILSPTSFGWGETMLLGVAVKWAAFVGKRVTVVGVATGVPLDPAIWDAAQEHGKE